MKQTIFSKGKGWYISATNYKNQEDKAYINLFFVKNTEPPYHDNGQGFSVKKIDIEEAKFTSYRGKVGLTIFKFEEIVEDNSKMGGNRSDVGQSVDIDTDDLPFF